MKLPPLFFERPVWLQITGGVVVPLVFGLLCGFVLGWSEILYYVLAGPIAIAGGFLGALIGSRVVSYAHSHRRNRLDRALLGVRAVPDGYGGAMLVFELKR